MGDKTQLLAFMLATRFKKPYVILAGIFTATVLNHAIASFFGSYIAGYLSGGALRYLLAAVFFGFAVWILIPDEEGEESKNKNYGAFLTTVVSFFLAEMGDKTQLSTIALGAKFQSFLPVTVGTTLGMLFADGPAVFLGERLTKAVPMHWVRRSAALGYAAYGAVILWKGI